MEYNDLFHFLKKAQRVNTKKYKLLGIKNIDLIHKLVEYDSLYFTYMFYHRKDIDDSIQSLRDEISTDELD